MRSIFLKFSVFAIILTVYSCGNSTKRQGPALKNTADLIKQNDDGTLDLDLKKAAFYNDAENPSSNTAEWNIVVSKPGRYKVWLSSATIDTMHLGYDNSVKISLQDERLDVQPVGDRIVLNSGDVKYPYYRADSYMGTFYIQDPGEYNLQVISEKVLAQPDQNSNATLSNRTKMMSVFLVPMTR